MRHLFHSFQTIAVSFAVSLPVALAADGPLCAVDKRSEWQRSVVIAEADKTIFKVPGVDFSFARTIKKILKTANLNEAGAEAAVQSMIESFKLTDAKHPVGNRTISFDARPSESLLTAAQLLDDADIANGMHPIGLFNRFDQAPGDWSYCGEHRIVYAQGDTTAERKGQLNRFLIIFEAAVVNPHPELREEGCRPIAEVWQRAKQPGRRIEDLAKDFEKLYYVGTVSADNSFSVQPVIHVEHFGNPHGQVRANIFKNQPWQLREWRADPLTGTFVIRPVGTNPQPSLYAPPDANDGFDPAVRKSFQQLFVSDLIDQLTRADADRKTDADLINKIGMGADLNFPFDDFVSNSQTPVAGRQDDPMVVATSSGAFIEALQKAIDMRHQAQPSIPLPSVQELLNRAGTTSCGGCHEFSASPKAEKSVGKRSDGTQISWPKSRGFVQIGEGSELSELLTNFFLPDRCDLFNARFFSAPATASVTLPSRLANTARVLSNFSSQFRTLTPEAKVAGKQIVDQVIDLQRAADRAQLGASGRIRHAD